MTKIYLVHSNILLPKLNIFRIHSTSSVGALSKNEPLAQSDAGYLKEGFWDKNKRLARPMSPHLTIYKPQMTTMLSITHRGK